MKRSRVLKTASALLLALGMILSLIALASCGEKSNNDASSDTPKGKELINAIKDIPDEDRAAYTALLDKYVEYLNGNAEAARDMYPKEYLDAVGKTADDIVSEAETKLKKDRAEKEAKYGADFTVTYSVFSEKNYLPFIDSITTNLKSKYGIGEDRVSAAYNVQFELTTKGSAAEETETKYLFPVKIDDSWYLINAAGDFN